MLIRSSALEVRISSGRDDARAGGAALLRDARPCLGDVRPVFLDDVSRMQQVYDGQFPSLDDVPKQALSLTVPFFLRVPRALVFVNGERKAAAVQAALEGPITEACPASALRRHPNTNVFLDRAAASRLG